MTRARLLAAPLICLAMALCACASASAGPTSREQARWATLTGAAPLVIAHRGASGLLPEHTEAAYRLAFDQAADVLEPDLMVSADGVLIVRHDPYLSTSTDVADRPEFADRRTTRMGRRDWWVMDFTAAELVTLNARQVFADRPQERDDALPVMTFEGFLDMVADLEAACGCTIPVEPEIKLPAEHAAAGLDPLPILLDVMNARDLNRADAPILVQSFDAGFLQRLDAASPVRLAMLYAGPDEAGYDAAGLGLEEIAAFAEAVGANKQVLFDAAGARSGFVEAAHANGLVVHAWTVRDDRAPIVGDTVEDELEALYALGVDGVFTDFPATAVAVRDRLAD